MADSVQSLPKSPTGIAGLDEITDGGLPTGRPTLVSGEAGSGKTLLATEFLVRGAMQYDEPGVFMTFEEIRNDIVANVLSLGFDLERLIAEKQLVVDHVHVERSEIEETGEYDLEGLFIRLGYAIDSIGAKRVVLDTLEALFSGLSNEGILRAELRRLFQWLKDRGVTAVITGEQGDARLTRQGLEEYVSDCVIFLDHRVIEQVSTRRLRIIKYRGSVHGTNEYPFLIDDTGFIVLPITSIGLEHGTSDERISSGVRELDEMLGGQGYFRGTSILVTGTAGTGKTSLACHFIDAACRRGERCLYYTFEESPRQIIRNMRSIGLDLEPWQRNGRLVFNASRPTLNGLEAHLSILYKQVRELEPDVVVIDPVSNLTSVGSAVEVNSMLLRLVDFLKSRGITALMTNLTTADGAAEQTRVGISSVMDSWLLVRELELNGERNRGLYVLKSRGMAHSNQVREFLMTDAGIRLVDVYVGPQGVLTGSARLEQEALHAAEERVRSQDVARKRKQLEAKRRALEAQVSQLRAAFESEAAELDEFLRENEQRVSRLRQDRQKLVEGRSGVAATAVAGRRGGATNGSQRRVRR